VIDENPQAIQGFLAALEQAIGDIRADPDQWDSLLAERQLVPEPLIGSYEIPPFPTGQVPSESQWSDVLDWAQEKALVTADVPYESSVTSEYLP
jgi:NitT/TauT family transport system substrate-binding protein